MNRIWTLFFLLLVLSSSSVMAVELLNDNRDGSKSYRCTNGKATLRVTVKYRGPGKFLVLRERGSAGHSGVVDAPNADEAARIACGD